MADRELAKLEQEDPELEITRIDVVTHPLQAWQDGIRFFPALKAGERILSGVLLNRDQISRFIRGTEQT